MTLGAAAEIEVGISRRIMTGGAGDERGDARLGVAGMAIGATDAGMAAVTVGAAHRRLVRSSLPIEIGHLGGMTGGAQSRGGIAGEIGEGRLVRRMAAQAILIGHFRAMGSMTLETGLGLGMLGMAFVAAHFRMDAGEIAGLLAGAFMAGDASRAHVADAAQILDFRCMGMMALGAVFDGKVRRFGRGMTIGAGRNRTVLLMAAAAADGLVLAAGLAEQRRRSLVTGAAETGADLGIENQGRRGMSGMAFLTILPGHRFGMGLMTLAAVGEEAVLGMTVDAGLLAVGIPHLVHIGLRLGMAGNAGGADVGHLR